MRLRNRIHYPALIVEKKAQKYSIFDIIHSQSDYVTFGRMPAASEYVEGSIFDSCGQIFSYKGSAGWPRFGEVPKVILEFLIIPSLLAKFLAHFIYYGPNVKSGIYLDLSDYKKEIQKRLNKHIKAKDRAEVSAILSGAKTFEDSIRAIDWWRLHGGKRDEDGHPIEAD